MWGIYFVTDSMNQENMAYNIAHEWMRLCNNISDFEVIVVGICLIFHRILDYKEVRNQIVQGF